MSVHLATLNCQSICLSENANLQSNMWFYEEKWLCNWDITGNIKCEDLFTRSSGQSKKAARQFPI